ncbi:MAG TPA: SgcJ/EcaC family oxidoreductase [Xanthomonadaceae bacterium]|nr:SgcJ/EcaC family oxidoreductase [Xanthomonadaceae bacterium]
MKLMFTTALAGVVILFASASQGASPDARDADRKQIIAVFDALDETWNTHDMRAHAELFHKDGIWVAWTGQVLNGAADYEATLAPLHKTVFKNSVHKDQIEELTFIAPEVAVVRGYGTVVGNEPTPDKVERYRILIVMTKREGVWKLGWGQKTRLLDRTPDPSTVK